MKKFLSILMPALILGFLFVSPVKAEDVAKPDQPEPVVDTAYADAVEMKEVTLKDGTKISIEGQNVFVVSDDGTKTPAPDGVHDLADGSTITTKGGMLAGE